MLTKRQKQILDFIAIRTKKTEVAPSLGEIRKHFRLKSVSNIHQHIEAIKNKGYLQKEKNQHRSIEVVKERKFFDIPILGNITAGQPIEVIENFEDTVSINNNSIKNPKEYYALNVIGDSMIDEGIFDGDIVVIKKQSTACNGQTVVAVIDDDKTTLKKIYKEKDQFRLQPANQFMKPLFRTEVEIRGVVIQVIRNIRTEVEKGFRTIDLFAGIGGVRLGFEKAGFNTVFANDFEKQCKITYDLNFDTSKLVVEDIQKIGIDDLPDFDFLLGGFPCQPFSIAGHRQGFEDEQGRGNLFFDITRIIEAKKPKGFLLENVKNLKGHDKGNTFKVIKKTLKDLGYHIKSEVLNTMDYSNVPQNRERIYIVGFKNKKHFEKFEFPKPIKLKTKIIDLLEEEVNEKYYYNGKPLFDKIKNDIKKEGVVYQWRRKYVRENKSGVCPTLTANMGTGGHNVPIIKDKKGIRKLTPRECARLQGFPDDYQLPNIADSSLYKQFGNSVSVPVVEMVANKIKEAITRP